MNPLNFLFSQQYLYIFNSCKPNTTKYTTMIIYKKLPNFMLEL